MLSDRLLVEKTEKVTPARSLSLYSISLPAFLCYANYSLSLCLYITAPRVYVEFVFIPFCPMCVLLTLVYSLGFRYHIILGWLYVRAQIAVWRFSILEDD